MNKSTLIPVGDFEAWKKGRVACPNCGSTDGWSRSGCLDCGQDAKSDSKPVNGPSIPCEELVRQGLATKNRP